MQTLLEGSLRCGVGVSVDIANAATAAADGAGLDDFTFLFSESGARCVIAVPEGALPAVYAAAEAEGVKAARIGTTGGELFAITGHDILSQDLGAPMVLELAEVGLAVERVLPDLFN